MPKISGTTQVSTRSRTNRTRSQTARSVSMIHRKLARASMANLELREVIQATKEEKRACMEAPRAH